MIYSSDPLLTPTLMHNNPLVFFCCYFVWTVKVGENLKREKCIHTHIHMHTHYWLITLWIFSLYVCLSVYMYACLTVCISACVCLSAYLSIFPSSITAHPVEYILFPDAQT